MKKPFLKYIIALLLFGSNGIVANYINLTSMETVLLRTFIGSVLLITLFVLTKQNLTFHKNLQSFFFLCISGIAMGMSWIFLYEAYWQIGVGIASLCYYCGPVIVIVLSPFIFKEKLNTPKVIGFLSVLCGIFLVNGNSYENNQNSWGIFCGLMSAFMYAFMIIFNKKNKKFQNK